MVSVAVEAIDGLVQVSSKLVNTTICAVGSARDMLAEQFGKVVIDRKLAERGRAKVNDLVLHDYDEHVHNFEGKDMTRETCEGHGLILSEMLVFSSDEVENEKKRELWIRTFNLCLTKGTSKLQVYEIRLEVESESTNNITFNFGYVAFYSPDGETFELAYAVHEAKMQLSEQVFLEAKKKKLLGITIKKEPAKPIMAPYQFSSDELKDVKEGYLKEMAMLKLQSEDSFLVPKINYVDTSTGEAA